jgi:hypothetical protein
MAVAGTAGRGIGGPVVARRLAGVARRESMGPAVRLFWGRVSSAAAGDDRELFECLVRLGWLGGPPVGWRRRCHRLMTQRGWAVGAFEPSDYCLGLTAIRCRPRSRTVSPSLPPFLGPRSSLCLTHRYDSFGRLRSAWQNSIRPQTRGATWPAAPAFDVYVHLIIACSTPSNACSIRCNGSGSWLARVSTREPSQRVASRQTVAVMAKSLAGRPVLANLCTLRN